MLNSIELLTAAKNERSLRLARSSFWHFRLLMHKDLIVGAWHKEASEHLQKWYEDYIAGKRPKILITVPPQHGKTTLVCDFILWLAGKNQDTKIIYASFSDMLGKRANRYFQRHTKKPIFKLIFPDFVITKETQELVLTGENGYFRNTTCGGSITGETMNCVAKGTLVSTNKGLVPIENLNINTLSCKILTFNKGVLSYEQLCNITNSTSNGLYRITTESGRVFECTGDHRVFTKNKGYTEAAALSIGENVVCVLPKGLSATSIRCQQMAKGWRKRNVLLKRLLQKTQANYYGSKKILQKMQYRIEQRNYWGILQALLENCKSRASEKTRYANKKTIYLQNVLECVFSGKKRKGNVSEILLSKVQKQSSFIKNERKRKSAMERWSISITKAAALCKSIQRYTTSYFKKGRWMLCDMQKVRHKTGSSSYRQQPNEQRLIKSSDVMQSTSCGNTRGVTENWHYDTIRNIEKISGEAITYDLTIANNHNFFANGVLVHNCGILDDVMKGRDEANSAAIREKKWEWLLSDFFTRFSDNGGLIGIMTRWHVDDPFGRLIESMPEIKLLKYPAINDKNEALFPELKSLEFLEGIKKTMPVMLWESLYQQNPIIAEGNFFKPDLIPIITAEPSELEKVRAWDFAATANGGDYTVGLLFGYNRKTKNGYILDVVRGQYAPEEVEKVLKNTADKDGKQVKILIPQDPGQAGKSQVKNFIKLLSGYNAQSATVSGDKETRANSVAAQVNVGNISMLRGGWNSLFIEELRNFPNGKNDDQVDALSDCYNDFIEEKTNAYTPMRIKGL